MPFAITGLVWCDLIETPPQGGYRTYAPGARHAAIVVSVPIRVLRLVARVGVLGPETRLAAKPVVDKHWLS